MIWRNPDNPKFIFHIERVKGKFDADNKVHGTNARMVHKIHGNEISELNAFMSAKPTKLEYYPGFTGGDAFSSNVVSTFAPQYAIPCESAVLSHLPCGANLKVYDKGYVTLFHFLVNFYITQ